MASTCRRHSSNRRERQNQQQGYSTRIQDLAADQTIPPADTVLLIDVLYQLDTLAQRNLLAESARSARRMIVIRTADPRAGFRSMITSALERLFRRVWPHSGAAVNALPPMGMQRLLEQHGFQCTITPCRAGTPFSNVLLIARRRG